MYFLLKQHEHMNRSDLHRRQAIASTLLGKPEKLMKLEIYNMGEGFLNGRGGS